MKEINKAKIIRNLRAVAKERYENSWEPELQINAFMEGVKKTLALVKLKE